MVDESTPPNSRAQPNNPLWKSVFTFFTKNYVLLLLLLLLSHRIQRSVSENNDDYSSELNEHLHEMAEILLQATTNVMRAQIEDAERKIEEEIEDLRNELIKRVHANDALYWAKFRELEDRIASVEQSLTSDVWKLKDEEFNKGFEKFKFEKRKYEMFDDDIKQDGFQAYIDGIIKKLDTHIADDLDMIDYVEMVVKFSEPYNLGNIEWLIHKGVHLDPCFPLKGDNGFVQFKLRQAIIPEAITLEHVPTSVKYDRSMAPKDCRVFGWLHPNSNEMVLLVEFSYDLEKTNVQTFNVWENEYAVNMITFEFTSNHGDPDHTCIYRIRVHGHEPDSLSSWKSKNKSMDSSEVTVLLQ